MAVPQTVLIFDEKAANVPESSTNGSRDTSGYGLKMFAVKTTGFTGTLNLLGRHYRGQSDWRVMRYATLTPGSGDPSATTDTAPAFVADTGYRVYLVGDPWAETLCTITGYSAGTITVTALFTDVPFSDSTSGAQTVALVTALSKSEDAAHASGDKGIMFLTVRKDTATALAGADGDYAPAETDANGALHANLATLISGEDQTSNLLGTLMKPVASATYAPTLYHYLGAAVTKANIKSAEGNVYAIRFVNNNAAGRWFQLHNKASAPAAGETPQIAFWVPTGTVLTVDSTWFAPSSRFATGIGWAVSTTSATFTDSATAGDHTEVTVRYV